MEQNQEQSSSTGQITEQVQHRFRHVLHLQHRVLDQQLDSTGVFRSQHRILMLLSKKEKMSQVEIANEMGISGSAVAVSLKKLENGGFICREAEKQDSRINLVALTDQGSVVVAQSKCIFDRIDKMMFDGLSDEQLEILLHCLEQMEQNLRSCYQESEKNQ